MGKGLSQNPLYRVLGNLLPQKFVDARDDVHALRSRLVREVHPVGGTRTRTRNSLSNAFFYYSEGRYYDAGVELDAAIAQGILHASGKNKHIYTPDKQLLDNVQQVLNHLNGRFTIYSVSDAGRQLYKEVTNTLAQEGYPVLEILAEIPGKVISYHTDAMPGDDFVKQHPESLDVLLNHCVSLTNFLHLKFANSANVHYAAQQKLSESLGVLTEDGVAAVSAAAAYSARHATTPFTDRSIPNHFVTKSDIPLSISYVKERVIVADFETLSQKVTPGHNLADIIFKTGVPLSEDKQIWTKALFSTLFPSKDLSFEVFLRTLRLSKAYPEYNLIGAAAKQFSMFGHVAEASPEGITNAWNACSREIIARSSQ